MTQSRSGNVFISCKDVVCEFNPLTTEVTKEWRSKEEAGLIREIQTNIQNQLVMLTNDNSGSKVQFYALNS